MTENTKPIEFDNRPIQEILETIKPGEVIPVWQNFTEDGAFAIASVTSDRKLQVFTNIPEEAMRPGFEELAQKDGLTLDYRCINNIPEKEAKEAELPFPEKKPVGYLVKDTDADGKVIHQYTLTPEQLEKMGGKPLHSEMHQEDGKMICEANSEHFKEEAEKVAAAAGLPLEFVITDAPGGITPVVEPVYEEPVVEASKTPLESDKPVAGETPAEPENVVPEANTGESEPTEKPIDDSLSRSKFLNKHYTPEEIDILRKAANNKPTATWGDDMRKAYATKAPQDAKMGVGDLILGAVWTVITLPIVIPWNILKTGAVTVNHFANKSKNVRMAKAAVVEVPRYRREHDTRKETEKPTLMERLKGFFSKLFKKKDAPVVAEPEKEQSVTPNVQPVEDKAGKQSLNTLVQEAQDTPDKASTAPTREKAVERE